MASPQGRVSTDAEYHNLTAIRSPDRPVRSKSLYRLSCPGPLNKYINKKDVWLYNDAVLLMDPNSIFPPCSLLLQTHSVQKYDSADVSRINIKIRNLSETYVNRILCCQQTKILACYILPNDSRRQHVCNKNDISHNSKPHLTFVNPCIVI